MANYMTFFPVGNGDMTLIQTKTNKYIMIDCNIRNAENDDKIYDCNEYFVLVKLFGNTLFGNHALYRNSIGVI